MDWVYRIDGTKAESNANAAGPWNPGLQHGSAPASLIASVVENLPAPVPMQVTRLTLDLLRPIPIGVLEIAVFAFVDPQALHTLTGDSLPLSDTAVYSIAFLAFWACTAVACGLTVLLYRSAEELNAPHLAGH